MSNRIFFLLLAGAVVFSAWGADEAAPPAQDLRLWYRQPAQTWEEALPVGNGRLGAMVFGDPLREHLQLNEATIWAGVPRPAVLNPRSHEWLARQSELIFAGKYAEADKDKLEDGSPASNPSSSAADVPPAVPASVRMVYQPLGDLFLHFAAGSEVESDYRRELDLDEAVARVSFRVGTARFTREIFSSEPDQVLVVRLSCDQPGQLTFDVTMTRRSDVRAGAEGSEFNPMDYLEPPPATHFTSDGLGRAVFQGQTEPGGIRFEARMQAVNEGGELVARTNGIGVRGANAVTLLVSAATDYRGNDAAKQCREQLAGAAHKSFQALRAAHVADYQRLFHRVSLDLGTDERFALPTDKRLRDMQLDVHDPRAKKVELDPQLYTLRFQYGRYLMIASSRSNSPLPIDLQGLWNDSLLPPWFGGYASDINQEMNYWLAGPGNLEECREPQLAFLEYLAPSARRAAQDGYGRRGLVINGMSVFGTRKYMSVWTDAAGWLAQDFWEHYEFTGDREFLARRAYPFMRECALFYLDSLVKHPSKGWLVTVPAHSPENIFRDAAGVQCEVSAGPTLSLGIIRDLFGNCIAASQVLETDADFRHELESKLAVLAPFQISKHGQLQEWLEDFEEVDPGHRHQSHLFPLYPGHSITPDATPDLFAAARKAVERRLEYGSGWTGWSRSWLLCCAARLKDGELAYEQARALLCKSTFPNLFDTHPRRGSDIFIFQIDGNLGGAAGLAEMLLQSQEVETNGLRVIELLPALPKEWPDGAVRGICARGGFEVDVRWHGGKLETAEIRSVNGGTALVRYAGKQFDLKLPTGGKIQLNGSDFN